MNHELIDSKHLLIGSARDQSGLAGSALKTFGIDADIIREEVKRISPPGQNQVIMNKLPQSPDCKKAIDNAIVIAESMNHNYVGTEHIILSLLRDSSASTVLTNLGMPLENCRSKILQYLDIADKEPNDELFVALASASALVFYWKSIGRKPENELEENMIKLINKLN